MAKAQEKTVGHTASDVCEYIKKLTRHETVYCVHKETVEGACVKYKAKKTKTVTAACISVK